MCGMGAWGVQSQQFSIYFIEHSFFYCFLSNVRRSNNNNMRGMQCDPVLILIFFPLSFFVFWSIGVENITEPLCAECSFQGGMSRERGTVERGGGSLEHADDLRADIFHTFHTHDMIKLELEMSSSKWQTTRYVDRYIHTSYICVSARYTASYLWTLRVQFPPPPPPPFHQAKCNLWPQHFQMNLKIIFLFAVEIVPIILKIEHNDCLPLSPYSLPLCLC